MATERAPHNMTGASSPSPYVASASTQAGGSDAWHAFDGGIDYNQRWVTSGAATGWLKMDMGAGNAFIISDYNVRVDNGFDFTAASAPKDWTLEGSNDNSAWTTIDTVTAQTGWSSGQSRAFVCDVQTTAYRYFRLNVSANNGGGDLRVAELYLQGEPAPAAAVVKGKPIHFGLGIGAF